MTFYHDEFEDFYQNHQYDEPDYHSVSHPFVLAGRNYCPCPYSSHRFLQDDNNSTNNTTTTTEDGTAPSAEIWEVVVTCLTIFFMFAALIADLAAADSIMLTALTLFMVTEIISISEGLAGFANEGLMTVLVLFVVAEGISRTGALDWYMGNLLGRPKSVGSAQVRLMVPIMVVSAFLNNTPVVAVMIPIVQKWSKTIRVSPQQLLIPLSFASIFGGTCTLIGTSTNLIVNGLLEERYADSPEPVSIGLFDLGEYGVPIAFAGMTYVLIASPFLLPGSKRNSSEAGQNPLEDNEEVLLGARLTQWSPAAGRSVKRSGLRDTGGIYLVSVHRFATGNVHRAVGQEFVLNVGDILYFTGLVEGFGAFCEEHGLEMITNEIEDTIHNPSQTLDASQQNAPPIKTQLSTVSEGTDDAASKDAVGDDDLEGIEAPVDGLLSQPSQGNRDVPSDVRVVEVGTTRESLVEADNFERMREISKLTDTIRGIDRDESDTIPVVNTARRPLVKQSSKKVVFPPMRRSITAAPKIVATIEKDLVVVGVDARDRPGLLLDISKGLLQFNLQLHHTEAAVVEGRSLSIWRCEPIGVEIVDVEQVWTVLTALLEGHNGILAIKKRGLSVIRARVTPVSRLLGRTATQVNFRERYKAAIVAMQRSGKNIDQALSTVAFEAGDGLVLQASDDSPLLRLKPPTDDFYKKLAEEAMPSPAKIGKPNSYKSLANLVKIPHLIKRSSGENLAAASTDSDLGVKPSASGDISTPGKTVDDGEGFYIPADDSDGDAESGGVGQKTPLEVEAHAEDSDELILRDLQVLVGSSRSGSNVEASNEFLTAMQVAEKSQLAGQTAAQTGLTKLPGAVLISIERPNPIAERMKSTVVMSQIAGGNMMDASDASVSGTLSVRSVEPTYKTIELEKELQEGDVLWFAGSATAVGDLRKIPGLISFESEEVKKMNENVHDRRLVQAVIARQGPLVGKTVKEVRFRTRYGAAVIAVHREGKRIHDHPGNIVLQAGDVLLLEAGSTFMGKSAENHKAFALLSEVKDSAPPRLTLLVPALVITAIMLIVATFGIASLLVCGLVASILMVAMGILSEQEARDAVNWEVYITIASAFGIGTALVNSGVADAIANGLVAAGEALGMGDAGLYGAVYLATMVISNIVTNNAAAALVFPIAMTAAEETGADEVLMSYTLMLGASASFMTPFGYTTNLMIYGPGGYKSKDFLRVGTPLQLILWIFTTAMLGTPSTWWLSWVITFGAFFLVVVIKARSSRIA